MNNEKLAVYDALLSKELCYKIGIFVIMLIVAIAVMIFFVKIYRSKVMTIMITVMGSAILLGVFWHSVPPYILDIKKQAYETYKGDFYVCFINDERDNIFIETPSNDKIENYKFVCDAKSIKMYTRYHGYFVVAENSESLVDIHFDKSY